MTINYRFGDVDAHGATIRARAASPKQEHYANVRGVLTSGGSMARTRQRRRLQLGMIAVSSEST